MLKTIKKWFSKKPKTIIEPMSFQQGFDLTSLPIITFYQKDKKFNFLLDTGSNQSVVDGNILDHIEHEMVNIKSTLFGMEGNTKEVSICKITISYKGKDYTYNYLVSDMKAAFSQIKQSTGVTLHGIIGAKFFNEYKYVLDFDELIAYSKI